ncbi:cytochrome P450 [Gloeothece citriformis PCC 7424]|uniref:Cytochrome P450 n=1 Tax=Gloeothece citriformis (strain PCC 7424) TaxID=65393 RepID=B7KH74_GLOC7|nr:cytochrome P450 [Gloeothece citriformis]ACK69283.1 cytochrome P450 [Gloeothece citriformis PCC 7424]
MTTVISSETKSHQPLPKITAPVWLQTVEALFQPLEYLEKQRSRMGDIYWGESFAFPHLVIIGDPKGIEQVFTADPNCFEIGNSNKIVHPIVGGYSLILLDGQSHQQQRKLLMPPFHGERMRNYGQTIYNVTQQVMEKWPKNQPFLMRQSTQEITLRVIIETVFGVHQGEKLERLQHLLNEFLEIFNKVWGAMFLFYPILQKDLGAWSPWGKYLRLRQEIDEILFTEIKERRHQLPTEDILSLMISAKDENGQSMSDQELRDELMTLLFAGHETTASAIAWAFYWIHRQPEIKQKLLEELKEVDVENEGITVAKLPYLSAVCAETLRIYPVAIFAFSRKTKVPMEIMGYQIEPGMTLLPSIYSVHHREDIYPNAKQFRPERFLERQFSPYEYLPFGGGNRRCLGYAFALFEMKLVLATILKQTQLTLLEPKEVKPMRRSVTFTPSTGIKMRVNQ